MRRDRRLGGPEDETAGVVSQRMQHHGLSEDQARHAQDSSHLAAVLERGGITLRQWTAASAYADLDYSRGKLLGVRLGYPQPGAIDSIRCMPGEETPAERAEYRRLNACWKRCRRVLLAASRANSNWTVAYVVDSVVLKDLNVTEHPGFLVALRIGLDALGDIFEISLDTVRQIGQK